jgi:hypothetical protein
LFYWIPAFAGMTAEAPEWLKVAMSWSHLKTAEGCNVLDSPETAESYNVLDTLKRKIKPCSLLLRIVDNKFVALNPSTAGGRGADADEVAAGLRGLALTEHGL